MTDELETAIRCFERWSGLQVVFYYYDYSLIGLYRHNRGLHTHRLCLAVKACGYEKQCMDFDFSGLWANAMKFRNGGLKLCPGGACEWIHSVYHDNRLLGMLLAGLRLPPPEQLKKYPLHRHQGNGYQLPFTPEECGIAPVDPASGEDEWIMEGLRQLAARVETICFSYCGTDLSSTYLPRSEMILPLIERYHRYPDFSVGLLAREFHLSRNRMYHLIKEATGKSFRQLCNEVRLAEAADLLASTNFLIEEISNYCHFSSPTYFFRQFKQKYGVTPRAYRRRLLEKEKDGHSRKAHRADRRSAAKSGN